MTRHHVCVGGPADGTFQRTIAEGERTLMVAVPATHDVARLNPGVAVGDFVRSARYELTDLKTEDGGVSFWRYEGMRTLDALVVLLNSHGARRG